MTDAYRAQAEQAAAFLGLALDPAHLDGVAANLDLLARHAARVMSLPLAHDTEPAPVFTP
jgi:hypothetical protein